MTKITADHLGRGAFIYIRQSTVDQLSGWWPHWKFCYVTSLMVVRLRSLYHR